MEKNRKELQVQSDINHVQTHCFYWDDEDDEPRQSLLI